MRKIFVVRVVRLWHRLPREAVAAPSFQVFKAKGGLSWWGTALPMAGG